MNENEKYLDLEEIIKDTKSSVLRKLTYRRI